MREREDTTRDPRRAGTLRTVRTALLSWYDRDARDLPWRRGAAARLPYRVLVAEVLLQQTQASRAAEAYRRFVTRFPDPRRLASADEAAVLEAWQGLGYYQRALRLQACARALLERHAGVVPHDVAALEALPGIGRYSARAIAARAFGAPLIAVDANVRRVGARVLDLATPSDVELEDGLADLLLTDDDPGGRHGDVSEALIELGATVCGPRSPACARCPLRQACRAHAAGRATTVPAPRVRRPRRSEELTLLVALRGTEVALTRRPGRGRWAGLWGFPSGDVTGAALPGFEHHLTHRRLEVAPRLVRVEALAGALTWMALERVAAGGDRHPVAAVDQRLARLLVAPAGREALRAAAALAAERRTA